MLDEICSITGKAGEQKNYSAHEVTRTWSQQKGSGIIRHSLGRYQRKVWGRGTSDTPKPLWAIAAFFRAAEDLLAQDYIPACDVYLASSAEKNWAATARRNHEGTKRRGGVGGVSRLRRGDGIITNRSGGIKTNTPWWKGKADAVDVRRATAAIRQHP